MQLVTRLQLSIMMLLEYFIWGAWFVAMGIYLPAVLKADGAQVGLAYGNAWFGAMVSPFFIGMIADRYFSAQKVLGVLHLVGAALLWYLAQIQDMAVFPWVLLVYSCVYMPTVALTNSVAMGQSDNQERDFPLLRVLGTVGWIIAGVAVNSRSNTDFIFVLPAILSVALGIFSFFLPDTPPKGRTAGGSIRETLGLDALSLFKDRSYATFFAGAVLLCIPLSFYYAFTGDYLTASGVENVTSVMGLLGQGSEVLFMLLMPFFLMRLGVRNILLVAMLAWVARYLLLSFGGADVHWPLYLAVLLHGICYDFFFVTGYIYSDRKAGEQIKSSAQGLFTIATYGLGMTFGSYLGGAVAKMFTDGEVRNWPGLWLVPAGIAAVILLAFLIAFKEKTGRKDGSTSR
ncbi:MAG: MFS transporter [Haliscomenobacteraceae bacterium CHB4]|nr:MFS transporter [Haliscomenobacteraceae bacterium CHB4]